MSALPSNYQIGGSLPLPGVSNPFTGLAGVAGAMPGPAAGAIGAGLTSLANSYGQSYQQALQANQTQYNNILSGYQQLMSGQMGTQSNIGNAYAGLTNQVMGTIDNVGASELQAIKDAYAQQKGSVTQQLVNSGLGNSTVMGSMQRGPMLDAQKAEVALANQMAQLKAGYQSQLGLANLSYANLANEQNTALGAQQLGFMGNVKIPYPDAGLYSNLAQAYGQMAQVGMQNDPLTAYAMTQATSNDPEAMLHLAQGIDAMAGTKSMNVQLAGRFGAYG